LATAIAIESDAKQFAALLTEDARLLAAFDDGEDKHLVFAYRDIRVRICLTAAQSHSKPVFVAPVDASAPIRLEAMQQFCALQTARPDAFSRSPFTPTLYHRRQLVRLLAIADAAEAGATARDIAFAIVFPNTKLSAARDWKGSSEQRQTRRLTREAERMIDGGFWRLPCFAPD
jgi:hypothetical protein